MNLQLGKKTISAKWRTLVPSDNAIMLLNSQLDALQIKSSSISVSIVYDENPTCSIKFASLVSGTFFRKNKKHKINAIRILHKRFQFIYHFAATDLSQGPKISVLIPYLAETLPDEIEIFVNFFNKTAPAYIPDELFKNSILDNIQNMQKKWAE